MTRGATQITSSTRPIWERKNHQPPAARANLHIDHTLITLGKKIKGGGEQEINQLEGVLCMRTRL
jgi:hypothetical protein